MRESISCLLQSVGLQAKLFASVNEFLKAGHPAGLVLDVRLPRRSGLDFQRELAAANIHLSIIFITGYGDIVRAMKGRSDRVSDKPFRDQDLLDAIQLSIARDRAWLEDEKALAEVRARFASLTPRERGDGLGSGWPPQ